MTAPEVFKINSAESIGNWTNGTGAEATGKTFQRLGIAQLAVLSATTAIAGEGVLTLEGVFSMTKESGTGAIAAGDRAYLKAGETTDTATNDAAGNYFIGYFANSALTGDTVCRVLLAPFSSEGARQITLAATAEQDLAIADFVNGASLTVLVTNTEAQTINLPAIASLPVGVRLKVRKISGGEFAVTIDPNASELINGAATYTGITKDGDTAEFVSNGTAWILASDSASNRPGFVEAAATGATTLTVANFGNGYLTVLCANTAAKTINLPSVADLPTGAILEVKKTSADAEILTIDPDGSETIAGGATYTSIDAANDRARFVNNGTAWILLEAELA